MLPYFRSMEAFFDLSLPKSWADLSDPQLLFFFRQLATNKPMAEIQTRYLCQWANVLVRCRLYGCVYLVQHDKQQATLTLRQFVCAITALDRKIQLELAPPTPEITEKEHEGQQVKPEAKGVRNGIRQYPEDTSPQIRNPSESIIANHTITGHPGLYAKEETRSKGLKI